MRLTLDDIKLIIAEVHEAEELDRFIELYGSCVHEDAGDRD